MLRPLPITANDVWVRLQPYAHLANIHWLGALRYAEERLAPVEIELPILRKRLAELAQYMDYTWNVDSVIVEVDCHKTPQASERYRESPLKGRGKLAQALKGRRRQSVLEATKTEIMVQVQDAIVVLVEKKALREKCEREIAYRLRQARIQALID